MNSRQTFAALLMTSFLLAGVSAAQDATPYHLIVNASNPVDSLTKQQVSELFLKKVRQWENGTAVMPVDQKADSEVRSTFSQGIHGLRVKAIVAFWRREVFLGRDVAPPRKTTSDEVVAYVRSEPGAIGYVAAGAEITGCKLVRILD